MISYIKGILTAKNADSAIVETQGIGYEISLSTKSLAELPSINNDVHIWIYMHVKDDGIHLYGFSSNKEKELFTKLINVSGIGPKIALAALSCYSAEELTGIIAHSNLNELSKIPGIGKKSAQRIVLELQGTLQAQAEAGTAQGVANSTQEFDDAVLALEAIGFSYAEVQKAMKNIDPNNKSSTELVHLALKNLGSR